VITPKLALDDLVRLVASRVLRETDDLAVPNLEALARRLCADHGVVDSADVEVVISGARASMTARSRLFAEARRYAPPVGRTSKERNR